MIQTNELKLNKTNMETDGEEYFDFDEDLNKNWDKIDEFAKEQRLSGVYFKKIRDITIQIPGTITEEHELEYFEVNGD